MNGQNLDSSGPTPTGPAPTAGADPIGPALLRCGQERFSGLLRVEGSPGGTICLRQGLVIAATTAASPGPESLLLRSGRVSEADWTTAYAAGAPSGRLAAELVERGIIGIAGLETVCLTAVFDAVFAMALCGVEACETEPARPDDLLPSLPVTPGIPPERLARETARRLAAATAWLDLGVSTRTRPLAVPPSTPPLLQAEESRHAVLLKANGRRTPRDIAFSLGRGVFAIMSEIARMAGEGLLEVDAPGSAGPPAGRRATRQDASGDSSKAASLPQRHRGTNKVSEVPPATAASRPSLPRRLLGIRNVQEPMAGEED
ncbi:hypothetical protein AB0B89_06480 [Sphaerisporangium sp. NPDC049002]|uniref:hypothetical protein n=1 Tax=Sphaerisporangium sp. NPDC049002 TaxID=3155392 RepID=UPI0033C66844